MLRDHLRYLNEIRIDKFHVQEALKDGIRQCRIRLEDLRSLGRVGVGHVLHLDDDFRELLVIETG